MSYIADIPYVGWVIPFLLVLGVVVFVHEYGHYIVGKWCGIKADVFSIGFGKELFHWIDKNGMRWRVGALPLGGYVKFRGDMNAASAGADQLALTRMTDKEKAGAFHLAPLWARALTVLAGPVFNFILSIFVFTAIAMFQGREVNEPVVGSISVTGDAEIGLLAGDRVVSIDGNYVSDFNELVQALDATDGRVVTALVNRGRGEEEVTVRYSRPATIDAVLPGGAAADAGLDRGDVITGVDGEPTPTFEALRNKIFASNGEPLVLDVTRGDQQIQMTLTPQMTDSVDEDGNPFKRPMIGVQNRSFGGVEPLTEAADPIDSIIYGFVRTWGIIDATLSYIYNMIFGDADASQLGGPIQIAKVSGQAAEQGLESLLIMIALISTSIGLINLFPIPVLDGGHLVFYALEAVRGRPIKERWQEIGNGLGLSMILLLMVFATINDLLR